MVWKTGNGRTVRSSRFGRARGKRSEGLLIHTKALAEGSYDEGEIITYSLGKQNRWLLPEVIKTSSVECELGKEELEVVLVERYTNEGIDRPDCFSVYNTKNSTTRKSKRKFARAKDLLSDIEETKTRYEVTYPYPSGSWQNEKQRRRQTARLGTRKENSFVNWNIEQDFDEMNESDLYHCTDEKDLSEHSSSVERSVTLDFGLLMQNSSKKKKKCNEIKISQQIKEAEESIEFQFSKKDCFYIESGDDMYNAHHELLAQIQETASHYSSYNPDQWGGDEFWHETQGRGGRGRGRARGRGRGRGGFRHYIPDATLPYDSNLSSESLEPSTGDAQHHLYSKSLNPSAEDSCVSLVLTLKETNPALLEDKWGEKYKESVSFPRAFVLNATPEISQCTKGEEVFVLFRLANDRMKHDVDNVKAFVGMTVVCNEESTHESVLKEFISEIKARSAKEHTCSPEDVVNIAQTCFRSNTDDKADFLEPRQPNLSLDVFTELFGWKSKALSLKRAQQEVKQSLEKKEKAQSKNARVTLVTTDDSQQECGICFSDLQFDDSDFTSCHTSLTACGHKFCNSCWKAHLKTQIECGHTDLRCPGHECNTAVDDVTLMSLVPSLYGRHLTKRLDTCLEMDPEWKWCPADQCKLVVKATTPQQCSVVCNAEQNSIVQPVPVACVCGTMWCFRCQEDAHWPAACDEARVFRQKNEGYAKMVKNSTQKSLIRRVNVKNCPFCNYPIEKGPGCNHMQCGLCNKQFCWSCLDKWEGHGADCKTKVAKRKVELPVNTKHLRSYEHFAVTSRMARATTLIKNVNKKLDKLERGVQIYATLSPKVKEAKRWDSCAKRHLNHLCENNTAQDLREVFSFKFQALLTLEGVAMVLSFMKDKRLALEFERLHFIVERLNEILSDFKKCRHQETLERMKHFVACGKKCLIVISTCRSTKQ